MLWQHDDKWANAKQTVVHVVAIHVLQQQAGRQSESSSSSSISPGKLLWELLCYWLSITGHRPASSIRQLQRTMALALRSPLERYPSSQQVQLCRWLSSSSSLIVGLPVPQSLILLFVGFLESFCQGVEIVDHFLKIMKLCHSIW